MKRTLLIMLFVYQSFVFASADHIGIGIVSVDDNWVHVSTTLSNLNNSSVLICLNQPDNDNPCQKMPTNDFKKTKSDERVFDIITEKEIYTFKVANTSLGLRNFHGNGAALFYPTSHVLSYKSNPSIQYQEINFTLDKKSARMIFCTSQEGIHVFSSDNQIEAHLYMGLEYEIEQSCKKEVFE